MEVFGVVYLIWNMLNGMKYVGQTIHTVEERFNRHACSKKSLIGRAIRKYGKENFRYGIIKSCTSKAEMDKWEKFLITALNTKKPFGYNMTDGGEGIIGLERTPEHCAKISASKKGKPSSFFGKRHTAKTIAKMSFKKIGENNPFFGKHHTADTKANLAAMKIGNKNCLGRHHTAESCSKMSVAKRTETFFKNLLCEMDKKNLSYRRLANLLGLTHETISNKMRGKVNFTAEQVAKLVEIFNKPAEYLMARDDGKSYIKPPTVHRAYSPYKNLLNEIESRQMLYTNLATILEVSLDSFSRRIRGKVNFATEQVAKLVEIFDKPAEYLMARDV